jgi:hypothetical protein
MFLLFCSPFRFIINADVRSRDGVIPREGFKLLSAKPLPRFHHSSIIFLQEQEQDAPATQELAAETTEAIEEVAPHAAAEDVATAPEDQAPPSPYATQALAEGEAPASEEDEAKEAKAAETSDSKEEVAKKVAEEDASERTASLAKPAAKKPLVARKPLVAAKQVCFQTCTPLLLLQHPISSY